MITTGAVLAIAPLVAVVVSVHWGFLPLLLLPLYLLWATASLALALEQRGLTDGLTGLANRAGLARQVSSVVAEGVGRGSVALCLMDLDRSKEVNDTLGHTVGTSCCRRSPVASKGRVGTPTWSPVSGVTR
ncbi:MAG: diguanylate cyclase [Nitriliruptoraceae bacterium]